MTDVVIHQSLHGYSEGHRLLESSVKLPDEIARLTLRMSDLSGGSVFPGFEEYLTGYPLTPLNQYVFAKTWYAPEMPRPGCVWTHSLILQVKDFDKIPSFESLIKFFVRPKAQNASSESPKIFGSYASALNFDPWLKGNLPTTSEQNLIGQLKALIIALYDLKKRNLLIPAVNSSVFENAVIKLWSQQWPALRSNFSFCTGSLSARGFAGRPFDIQCAPPQLIREITNSALAKQSQEMAVLSQESIETTERWINEALSDALTEDGGQFRQVLWSLAEGQKTEDFQNFASVALELLSDKHISLRELIALVAQLFPDASTGMLLKRRLLAEDRAEFKKLEFSEWEILSELSTSAAFAAFGSQSLNLRGRANALCRDSDEEAKQLISQIFKGPINSLGEDVLAGLLEAMNPEIARRITWQQPQFLPTLFRAKPELGKSPELWQAGGDRVREMFEALSSANVLGEEEISEISEAIIASGTETLVRKALEKWGKPAVFGVLNHVASSGVELTERVMGALTFHNKDVMKWLSVSDRPLFAKIVCAHIVAPHSYQIKDFGTEIWLRTYQELRDHKNYTEINYVATLLLALGLQNSSPFPEKVVALCFEHIHQLVWDDKMPDSHWIIIDPVVPHLLWLYDWDKCERLRRGLVKTFVTFSWPRERLSDCVKNDELLHRVLQAAQHVDGGVSYFRRED